MDRPDIGIIYSEKLPSDLVDEFQKFVCASKLSLVVEEREEHGAYACAEWYIPAAIVAYLSKSYFDGFLKEMGKDHYQVLKSGLSTLVTNVMAKPEYEPTLVGTIGKLSSKNPFSNAISIFVEASDGFKFHLLIPKSSGTLEYEEIVQLFLIFLNEFHSGIRTFESIGFDVNIRPKPSGGVLFVHVNPDTNQIERLDPKDYV